MKDNENRLKRRKARNIYIEKEELKKDKWYR